MRLQKSLVRMTHNIAARCALHMLIGISTRSSSVEWFYGYEHVYWRYPMSARDTSRKRARHSRRAQVRGGETPHASYGDRKLA